jgi:hypothetical protein
VVAPLALKSRRRVSSVCMVTHSEIRVLQSVDRQWTLQPSLFHEVDQDPHMAAV